MCIDRLAYHMTRQDKIKQLEHSAIVALKAGNIERVKKIRLMLLKLLRGKS